MSSPAHTSSPASTVTPELVLGKREEVYWEKVPEKVRRQAVEKALKLLSASDRDGVPEENVAAPSGDGDGTRRKRRK
jgi:ribosomal protein L4